MALNEADQWIQIGEWRLSPRLNLLEGNDRQIRLEPRHADLLRFFADHRGEVVSTEEILSGVWHGMVVGDHSVYQAIAKLRKALGDNASRARYIETVSKRGYRLIAEVTKPTEATPGHAQRLLPRPVRGQHWWFGGQTTGWRLLGLGMAIVALGWMAISVWLAPREPNAPIARTHPHLAVLPFESLSVEATDAFVARGFAIELAVLLGQLQDLVVLGPFSTGLVAADTISPIEIASALKADLVVSGSLRRSADQLRISATLTDGHSGTQLWSQIFEGHDGDVFQAQRAVATDIADALKRRLIGGETRTPSHSPKDAYDDFLLGQYYRSIRSAVSLERARGFFAQSLTKDPAFTPARRDLANTELLLSFYGNLPLREALDRAAPLLKQCLDETPEDAELLGAVGLLHYLRGAFGLAEEYLRNAVAKAPGYVEGWMWLGLSERQQGRLRDALDAFEHARGIEPLMVTTVVNNANALAWSGQPEPARAMLRDLANRVKEHSQLYRVLSNIDLETGQLASAHAWALEALAIDPTDRLARVNMAMILSYLGQQDAAEAMMADQPAPSRPGRATQLYLDRMALTAPRLLPANMRERYAVELAAAPDVPEIEWRLANARIGLIDYFSGDQPQARKRLERSLAGRIYPIERTDYDLFVCTSLVDTQRRLEDKQAASHWLARCQADFEQARELGWQSLALGYVAARLSMLQGEPDQALEQLESVVEQGFSNGRLLGMDPLLEPLRKQPGFQALAEQIRARIRSACSLINTANSEQGSFACAPSPP